MTFDLARHNMVVEQLEQRGIADPRVLEAMEWVPRHEFVPADVLDMSYDDRALPIGFDQTISQPYTVAFMLQEAHISAADRVLDVGTGSGYAAAVLSLLAHEVYTIERVAPLHRAARERLQCLGYHNVRCYLDDGTLGRAAEAPFDVIIVAAGAEAIPRAYEEQLADNGRLIIPVGPPSHQEMMRLTRRGHSFHREQLGNFGFVPLISGKL